MGIGSKHFAIADYKIVIVPTGCKEDLIYYPDGFWLTFGISRVGGSRVNWQPPQWLTTMSLTPDLSGRPISPRISKLETAQQ